MNEPYWMYVANQHGLSKLDAANLRATTVSAVSMLGNDLSSSFAAPEDLCRALAARLSASRDDDGAIVTARWLRKLKLSPHEAAAFKTLLDHALGQEFDPDTALDAAIDILISTFNSAGYDLAQGFDDPLQKVANVRDSASVACMFPLAAPAALRLARRCNVAFYCRDETIARQCTLLSGALRSDLEIHLSGQIFRDTSRSSYSTENFNLERSYDSIITLPPLGANAVLRHGTAPIGETIEQGQFFHLRDRWQDSFTTIISERQLLKGRDSVPQFLRWLLNHGATKMKWLPPSTWGNDSGLQTYVVRLAQPV